MRRESPSFQAYVTPWGHVRAIEVDSMHCPFALDAAADKYNAKAKAFITKRQDGRRVNWIDPTFYNCEYAEQEEWLEKAVFEARRRGIRSAGLLKAAISERYWRPNTYEQGRVDLYDGRIAFLAPRGGLRLKTKRGVRVIAEGKPVKGSDFPSALVLLGPGFKPRTGFYRDGATGLLIPPGTARIARRRAA